MAKMRLTRRRFLKGMGAGAIGVPFVITSSALGNESRVAASDRITMGLIGIGSMGSGHLRRLLGDKRVQIVAVCDVDSGNRSAAEKRVNNHYAKEKRNGKYDGCMATNDFRDVIERDDIDAVLIATPDHWHAIIAIQACKNGKDVYCEKPLSLTVHEGRAMVNAARRYSRVFSSGSQRVLDDYRRVHECVRGGAIGRIREAFVGVGGPPGDRELPAQPVPEGLDWNMWLGPAPWRPYNRAFHPRRWRGHRDFGGGDMADWGAHKFAAAMFAMELESTGPVEILPPDGEARKNLAFRFANGIVMYHGGARDLTIKGDAGEATRNSQPPPNVVIPEYRGTGGIHGDFLHCVRTRQRPFRDVEYAHRAATVCHLGNIAYWLNRPLKWDPEKEEIIGDEEASRWLSRPKRAPWKL